MKFVCFCIHLHENAKRKKTQNLKKTKMQKNAKYEDEKRKTPKHEDAYFQERRRKKTKKRTKTKTQILGERCQLSSGEYCIIYSFDCCKRGSFSSPSWLKVWWDSSAGWYKRTPFSKNIFLTKWFISLKCTLYMPRLK